MDLPRLRALNAYQQKSPPTNIVVQRLCRILEAFAGIEDSHQDPMEDDEDEFLEVLANFPQGG